jgi:hypothetical protein
MSIVYVQTDGPAWPGWQVWTMDSDGGKATAFLVDGAPIVATHPRFQPMAGDVRR